MLNGIFERVLVIAPHSDDDILGCGGLMKRVKKSGGRVHVAVVSVGDVLFYHSDKVVKADTRIEEFHNALDYLGVDSGEVLFKGHEQRLHMLPIVEIITEIDKIIKREKPTAVFIPYPSFHQDHKTVFDASFAALRPTGASEATKLVAMYEYPFIVWDANQNVDGCRFHIDITNEIDDKVNAMRKHVSQLRPANELISLETIRVWAQRRGLEVNAEYAEAFKALRMKI